MIHPTTPEQLLTMITDYERVHAANANPTEKVMGYDNLAATQQDIVDNIVNELETSVEIALKALDDLGDNDARNLGQSINILSISTMRDLKDHS